MRNSVIIALSCALGARAAGYSTYIGDIFQYQVSAIAADASGNTYVTGSRIIVPASYAPYSAAVTDIFVCKLDPSGNLTLIGTYGGKGNDYAAGIAVDPAGNIYVAGSTTSTDFPLHNPLQSVMYSQGEGTYSGTGFLMKLAPDGAMVYSTYLGGTAGYSALYAVAADSNGNAYVTGATTATDYPHTAGMPEGEVFLGFHTVISGAFFAKVNPAGSGIVYAGVLTGPIPGCESAVEGSSCFLSSVDTSGTRIAVDAAGNAYLAGTAGFGLPTTTGALLTNGIGAFVAKVNSAGTGMAYVTYLGAGDLQPGVGTIATDDVYAIAADAAGNAYISGSTADPNFPATAGAYQNALTNPASPPFVGPPDAFVAKLNPTGSGMVWATYLGGTDADAAYTIAVDSAGDVWVSGTTDSSNFPVNSTVTPNGSEFMAEFNPTGSTLLYSATFPSGTVATALAVDATGTVHVAGAGGLITAFPASTPPSQASGPIIFSVDNAAGSAVADRIVPAEVISIYGINLGPAAPPSPAFNSAGFLPTALGGVTVTIGGIAAPLLYVSETQINAVAPVELTPGVVALRITVNDAPLPDFRVLVDAAAPAVFQNSSGTVAVNQDGTLNSAANPAPVGSYVAIWATGTGYSPASDGRMATAANQFCTAQLLLCPVFQSDGTPVIVYYSGAAPDAPTGVVQIDFQVTASQSYYLSLDGVNSSYFTVYTAPAN